MRAEPDGKGERQPWDVGRFVNTVTFFNQGLLQKSIQGLVDGVARTISGDKGTNAVTSVPVTTATASSDPVISVPVDGVVLVTGATGGVGKRVVGKLLAGGKHVRALVRDKEKATKLLAGLPAAPGGALEVVAADLVQARTLLPEYFDGVRAVVSCSAVKIQPKEGDDSIRSKYMQGIKFYDPEVVGDTPESVELNGMKNLLAALGSRLGLVQGVPLIKADGVGPEWGALDDVVMGGVSVSTIQSVTGAGEDGQSAMVFKGLVSTSNSGGFASVRSRNFDPPLDLKAFEGVELRLKGNGLRYKLIVRPDSNWDGVAYCHSFDTTPGEWQTIRVPFTEFFPVFRARRVQGGAPLDPSKIASVQLMLSKFEYDGALNPAFRAGEFELPITKCAAYMPQQVLPKFVHVSSAGVTRPNRPGIDVDQEPPAVKLNTTLGGLLDYKLAGEDALRSSGIPMSIVRPCALTEEPRGMPLLIDQGDTIKGKVGREDIAELCCALLGSPLAVNTTFEVKSTVPFSQPWQWDPSSPPPPRDWATTLKEAGLVAGVTGKTINGVYTGKSPEAEVAQKQAVAA